MSKSPKESLRGDAEARRERAAAAGRDADADVEVAGQKLDELVERSGEAEAASRAESAARRKALADEAEKKLPKRG